MNELHHDTQAIAARLTALVAAAERLIAADDGSQEKADAIDALYLNFNYREIRSDLAHVETLTQQVAAWQDSAQDAGAQATKYSLEADTLKRENARLTARLKEQGDQFDAALDRRLENSLRLIQQAEQQRDAAHAALRMECTCREIEKCERCIALDAALAASAPQKEEKPSITVSDIRTTEENEGPLVSTDLYLEGRGMSLLCNVKAGEKFTYSFIVDGAMRETGTVGLFTDRPAPAQETERGR